jgi:hypothetical protein
MNIKWVRMVLAIPLLLLPAAAPAASPNGRGPGPDAAAEMAGAKGRCHF